MASIADVFFRALLEDKDLQVDAQKSGDKAGETLGTRMSKGISLKMRAGLGVISGAAAIATKGMVELDDVTAQYVADTGASADEADRARKSINAMAGRNLQPMREIGGALGKVHTDLGLTGDAADATAEQFLHFARITKRDASEEVRAFDDILDAYGKTAADIPGIMDKLVKSHEKYGGAINADEAALSAMAPQLKAFNLGIDDGIALLDLFKSSGLDAALVPKALNSAIQKLDGRPLKDFLAELSSIEDPGKRAQRAIEIFGSKAGVALANAIKPGIGSLDAFRISTEEATGATNAARDALDSTWSNRIQLAIKGATSKLIEFGSAFGPVLTGAASLASLGGALGLDRFAATFVTKLAQAGKAGGEALIDAAGTATGAAGTIFGNVIAQPIIDAFDPDKNSLLGKISRKAIASGARVGAIWGAAMAAGTRLASVVGAVLTKLPGSGIVRTAALASAIKIGTLQGTAMGGAMALALKGGFLIGLAAIAPDISKATSDIGLQIHKALSLPDLGDFNPKNWQWPLGSKNAPDWARLGADTGDGVKTVFTDAETQAALAAQRAGEHAGSEMGDAIVSSLVAAGVPEDVAQSLAAGAGVVTKGADTGIKQPVTKSLAAIQRDAKAAAAAIPGEMASAMEANRQTWQDEWTKLTQDPDKPLTAMQELARIKSRLTSNEMKTGLRSQDPVIRANWVKLHADLEARQEELRKYTHTISYKTASYLEAAIRANKGKPGAQAQLMKIAVQNALGTLPSSAYGWGAGIGSGVADGITSKIPAVGTAAGNLAAAAYKRLHVSSPAEEGPLSKDGGTEGWGQRLASLLASGMVQRIGAVEDAASRLAAATMAPIQAPGLASPHVLAAALSQPAAAARVSSSVAQSSLTVNGGIHLHGVGSDVSPARAQSFGQQVLDEVASGFRAQNARLPIGGRA